MSKVMIKWIKRSLLFLLMLILFIMSLIAVALWTNSGLKVVLWGVEKAIPELQIQEAEGAIFPAFTLSQISFIDPTLGIDLRSDEMTLAIKAQCFMQPSICVEKLKIDGLSLSFPKLPSSPTSDDSEAEASEPLLSVTSPFPIAMNNVELNNIELDILGNKVSWDRFSTALKMQERTLTLYPTLLSKIDVELARSEQEQSNDLPAEPPKNKDAPITLPEINIPLAIDIKRFDIDEFELKGESPVNVSQFSLSAFLDGHNVNVRQLELDMPQANFFVKSEVALKGNYPLSLDASARVKQGEMKGQEIELSMTGAMDNLEYQSTLSGVIEAQAKGNVTPLEPSLPFDVTIEKGKLKWPFEGKPDYLIGVSKLTAMGSLKGYQVGLTATVDGEAIPKINVDVKGDGDLNQINLQSILLKTLGGSLSGKVMANWQAPINWNATLDLENIQPGMQWEQAEGTLSGSLETSGKLLANGGWHVELPLLDIQGVIREYPLNIQGSLQAEDRQGKGDLKVVTEKLSVKHGPNGIQLSGQLDNQWNINTVINVPQLSKTIPELYGNINGNLSLRGDLKQPKVMTNLVASQLKHNKDIAANRVQLSLELSPFPTASGQLKITANEIQYQDKIIDSVDVNFSGTQSKHELNLSVLSDLINSSLRINGGIEEQPKLMWNGKINQAEFSTVQGEWKLDRQVDIQLWIKDLLAKVQTHCWVQDKAKACLTEDLVAGESGEINLEVLDFNFDQISMFVPKQTQLLGKINMLSSARWSRDKKPEIDVSISLPKGKLIQTIEQPVTLGWESIKLNAKLINDELEGDWSINLSENGDVQGSVVVKDVLDKKQNLNATLELNEIDLKLLQPLVGEYGKIDARVNSKLTLSGPISHPKVTGDLIVDDIVAIGDISPIQVNKGQVVLTFDGHQAALNAAIQTKDGELNVTGDADWADLTAWNSQLKVFAEELQVDVPPMVKIKVKPNMQISLSPTLAKIDGDIYLPWGRITVEELPPSAVGVSSDEVILNQDLAPKNKERNLPMKLETNVNIHVGDDFKLSAFGLTGKLNGKLNVAQKDKGPFVIGEIEIKNGQYRSFGQDLIIKEGKILMNGPVDQPYLAIKAIRNPENTQDDVIAGIQVTGPVNEPTTTIFSEPAMAQANALSYLLRGQNIDGKSGGNAMTTALIGLSLAKSGRVVGEIGEAFGVSDLQLDTAGSGDESQVTVSGYITPELQVKYGVGIFDSLGEFTVRYRLMKDLYLEAVSGVNSAVDLLYQFEFD